MSSSRFPTRSERLTQDMLMMTIGGHLSDRQIEHLGKLGNPASCTPRNGNGKLTSVRGLWDVEGGVEAAVHALPSIGQDELLQPPVQQEGATPVHTYHG